MKIDDVVLCIGGDRWFILDGTQFYTAGQTAEYVLFGVYGRLLLRDGNSETFDDPDQEDESFYEGAITVSESESVAVQLPPWLVEEIKEAWPEDHRVPEGDTLLPDGIDWDSGSDQMIAEYSKLPYGGMVTVILRFNLVLV